ncbi:MAG: ABC transporter permease [Filifactoraceae bacterium]
MRKQVIKFLRNPIATSVLAIIIGLGVGMIILAAAGYNPVEAYGAMIDGIIGKPKYLAQVLIKSTPLIFTGFSVAFAFKTGLFNIGAEGQYIVGSIAAVVVGAKFNLPPGIHFMAVILAAILAAGIWGGFVGLLKSKFGIHEVITCIMMNWIALYLNNYLISTTWLKKPGTGASFEVAESSWSVILNSWKFSDAGKTYMADKPLLLDTLLKTDLNYGIILALVVAILLWFVLRKTTLGFELRAVGSSNTASEYAGINVNKNIILSMAIAGALAGLAGALQITGIMPHRITSLAAFEGAGFDGISVALIAASNPLGVLLSGLLFGALKFGSYAIQSKIGAPSEIISIVIGIIVFFVAISKVFVMLSDKLEAKDKKGGS